MLKQAERLSRSRVNLILKKGFHLSSKNLKAIVLPNKAAKNRYSIVISKKSLSLATDRNTLRRRVFEAIRTLPADQLLAGKSRFDSVILARPILLKLDFNELKTEIQTLINQALTKLKLNNEQ